MKKFAITILATMTMAQAGFFQEPDKQLHMKFSVPFGAVGGMLCKSDRPFFGGQTGFTAILCGTAIGMIPGLVKEGMDSRQPGNKWDNRDLAADAIGAFIGAVGTVTIWEFSSGEW